MSKQMTQTKKAGLSDNNITINMQKKYTYNIKRVVQYDYYGIVFKYTIFYWMFSGNSGDITGGEREWLLKNYTSRCI